MADRRQILQQVADGKLSPEDADRLLRETDDKPEAPPPPSEARVRCVKVSAGVGGIEIVGDDSVTQAEVEGPHRAEIDGETLVIHGDWDDGSGGFSFRVGRHGRRRGHWDGNRKLARLRIRANPALDVDAELDAGLMSVKGMRGHIRVRLAAGPVTLEDFTGELDVAVNAGAVRANGKLTEGESRIRSDAGAVRVVLDPSSSVRVVAQAALGKVLVPYSSERPKRRFAGDRGEAVIGDGVATLRVETAMGSVHVTTNGS
jgi:SHOCT-like protein/putative adhesin